MILDFPLEKAQEYYSRLGAVDVDNVLNVKRASLATILAVASEGFDAGDISDVNLIETGSAQLVNYGARPSGALKTGHISQFFALLASSDAQENIVNSYHGFEPATSHKKILRAGKPWNIFHNKRINNYSVDAKTLVSHLADQHIENKQEYISHVDSLLANKSPILHFSDNVIGPEFDHLVPDAKFFLSQPGYHVHRALLRDIQRFALTSRGEELLSFRSSKTTFGEYFLDLANEFWLPEKYDMDVYVGNYVDSVEKRDELYGPEIIFHYRID